MKYYYCIITEWFVLVGKCFRSVLEFGNWNDWSQCEGFCGRYGRQSRVKSCYGDEIAYQNATNCSQVSNETFYEERQCNLVNKTCLSESFKKRHLCQVCDVHIFNNSFYRRVNQCFFLCLYYQYFIPHPDFISRSNTMVRLGNKRTGMWQLQCIKKTHMY